MKVLPGENDLREHVAPLLRKTFGISHTGLLRSLRKGDLIAHHDRPKGAGKPIKIPSDYWNDVKTRAFTRWISENIPPPVARTFLYPVQHKACELFRYAVRARDPQRLAKHVLDQLPLKQNTIVRLFSQWHELGNQTRRARSNTSKATRRVDNEYSKFLAESDDCESRLLILEHEETEREEKFWNVLNQVVQQWPKHIEKSAGEFTAFVYGSDLNALYRQFEGESSRTATTPAAPQGNVQVEAEGAIPSGGAKSKGPTEIEVDDWAIEHMVFLGAFIYPYCTKSLPEWRDVYVRLRKLAGKPAFVEKHYTTYVWKCANKGLRLARGSTFQGSPEQARQIEDWYFAEIRSIADTSSDVVPRVKARPKFANLVLPSQGRRAKRPAELPAI